MKGIQFGLRRGINLNCKFNVEFRLDVLVTSLVGKVVSLHLEKENYNSDDFNPTFFPVNWFIVYEKLGNGCTFLYA